MPKLLDQPKKTAELSPDEQYRRDVFAAGNMEKTELSDFGDPIVLEAACRPQSDFAADVATFRMRRKATESLEAAKAMEREAERLAGLAADDGGHRPTTDFKTVAELFFALDRFRALHTPGELTMEKLNAHRAKMESQLVRTEAVGVLMRTYDPAISRQQDELRNEIGQIAQQIEQRRPIVTLEDRIAEQTEIVETFAVGRRTPGYLYDPRDTKELWRLFKDDLRGLMAQRPMVAPAQREDEADRAKIAKLEGRIAELEQSKMATENMQWSN